MRKVTEKSSVMSRGFYHTFLYNYIYTNCILVIRLPDKGHRRNRNMLTKNNNTWLNICTCVFVTSTSTRKVGYAFIMKENSGHRIIQELSQCLFSVCFNNSISFYYCVLYGEMKVSRMKLTVENRSTWRKTCPTNTLSIKNPTRTDLL